MMLPELGEPLANGRTAAIYAWQSGQVLKLFYPNTTPEDVAFEQRLTRAIQHSGLPVPVVGEIVHFGERQGLVYQRIDGPTMLSALASKPWRLYGYARLMAQLHVAMHALTVQADLPDQQQRLRHKLEQAAILTSAWRDKVLAALAAMPAGNRLCHNDFHPDNILLGEQGAVVIDWMDAALGNPLADVARTSIIFQGAIASSQIESRWQKTAVRLFHTRYLHHYFAQHPGGRAEFARWRPIVAAARLSEGIPELESWLLAQVERG